MKKNIYILFFIFFVLGCKSSSELKEEDRRNFLWKVSSNNSSIYLLGSIHVLNKEMYPLDQAIEDAYDSSLKIAVEANAGSESADLTPEIMTMVSTYGLYRMGDDLFKNIPKKMHKKVKDAVNKYQLPNISRLKPWLAALTILEKENEKNGILNKYGIDNYMIKKAREQNKEIMELESVDFQIKLLANMDEKIQLLFLESTLDETEESENSIMNLMRYWKNGDVKAIESSLFESKGFGPDKKNNDYFKEYLFTERNYGMADKVSEYLNKNESVLVIVGAGHLVGEEGVIRLLEKKGYDVNQVEYYTGNL